MAPAASLSIAPPVNTMGVFYHIQPLDDEMALLLEEMAAAVPESDAPSRFNRGREGQP